MAEQMWTREELEAAHPDGTVLIQIDSEVRTMTTEEWSAWIAAAVDTRKPVSAEGVI